MSDVNILSSKIVDRKVVIRLKDRVCETPEELLGCDLFVRIFRHVLDELSRRQSRLLDMFPDKTNIKEDEIALLLETIRHLSKMNAHQVAQILPGSVQFTQDPDLLEDFLRHVYNSWRSFDRFLICDSDHDDLTARPYRTFQSSGEQLMHLIRRTYRDVQVHACRHHPNIYRQIAAGAGVVAITDRRMHNLPAGYEVLDKIPVIRDIMLYPPLVINPPMNKRTGRFDPIGKNPLDMTDIQADEWLCYPALVGKLLINIYFHESFYELGFALANLFELADDTALNGRRPDAVFLYGVPGAALDEFGKSPTVFFHDVANSLLVGAIPNRPEFGYFGYLKKMALTLHNICIMQQGRMPFHGALFRILLKGGKQATVLVMGDTGTGKSETLEAFRVLGKDEIQDIMIIADDMGSLDIDDKGRVIGYGTEIGAFVRLDDLQPGYAFGQLDRMIIMNAGQVNARIVVPVTIYKHVVQGYPVDAVLYSNNFEPVDDAHPVIEKFGDVEAALPIFRQGEAMSKGTTTSTGLTVTYFANVFGPDQFQPLHDTIANQYFQAFFDNGLFVGRMRTRLAIPGWEQTGPEASARALLQHIRER